MNVRWAIMGGQKEHLQPHFGEECIIRKVSGTAIQLGNYMCNEWFDGSVGKYGKLFKVFAYISARAVRSYECYFSLGAEAYFALGNTL